jgi:hypothetical protein
LVAKVNLAESVLNEVNAPSGSSNPAQPPMKPEETSGYHAYDSRPSFERLKHGRQGSIIERTRV